MGKVNPTFNFQHSMNFVPQTCVAAVFLLSLMDVRSATHHVATHGDDRNPSTLKKPFASLDRARDAGEVNCRRPNAVAVLLSKL